MGPRNLGQTLVNAHARAGTHGVVSAGATSVPFDATATPLPDALPSPAELLAGALAACMLKNFAHASSALGFRYHEVHVDVTLEHQHRPPRFVAATYSLRVTTDEPPRRLTRVHGRMRDLGTVYNTLASVCDIQGTVLAVSPAGAPQPPGTTAAPGAPTTFEMMS